MNADIIIIKMESFHQELLKYLLLITSLPKLEKGVWFTQKWQINGNKEACIELVKDI